MNKILTKCIFFAALYISFDVCAFVAPTERYLVEHSLEAVKASIRLDGATFEQKPIFDKAVSLETSGFFGYFAASSKFRTYQDLIRLIFEEKLAIAVPKDFHFLAVPLYPKRDIKNLDDVYRNFFESKCTPKNPGSQLFAITLELYANYKSLGLCPAKNFALGTSYEHTQDLEWLCNTIGLDADVLAKADEIRSRYFAEEDRVLLQFFDTSQIPYDFIDTIAYPAYPTGFPYKNQAISDYTLGNDAGFSPQFFLVLDEHTILNPQSPFVIKRYTKIQPTKLKNYEQELRELIKATTCDQTCAIKYFNDLTDFWNT